MNRSSSVPRRRVELIDTSVLLEILKVPFESDRFDVISEEFDAKHERGVVLQIPMATVLETGAHIRRINDGERRRSCARNFIEFLESALDTISPWEFRPFLWDDKVIRAILNGQDHGYTLEYSIGFGNFESGDLAIIEEWRLASKAFPRKQVDVDIWTLDTELRGIVDGLRGR